MFAKRIISWVRFHVFTQKRYGLVKYFDTVRPTLLFVIKISRSRGVLRKRCSENMQQIYRRTPMPKCDFNKVALQKATAWGHTGKVGPGTLDPEPIHGTRDSGPSTWDPSPGARDP